jgi:aspartate aminotransferase
MSRRFARRLDAVRESATLAVKAAADALREEGRDVVDLGPGEPDFPSPEHVKEAAHRALDEDFTHYTSAAGIRPLREALADHYARLYDVPLRPEETLVGPGGKGVLFATMMALLDPGDEVAIFAPYWVSFPEQVRLAGATPVVVPTDARDGFLPRAARLEERLTSRTRMVVVNSPSNPSGSVLPEAEVEALVDLAADRDLWLVSDETYEVFTYGDREHVSFLGRRGRLGGRLLMVSSFSKTFAMTGWRVGYLLAAPEVIRPVLTVQSHDASQAASVSQRAALAALTGPTAPVEAMVSEFAERRMLLIELLAEQLPEMEMPPPEGAFYAFPRVESLYRAFGVEDDEALAAELVRRAAVAAVPGSAFGTPHHLRLSYACSRETLAEGVRRIARVARGHGAV